MKLPPFRYHRPETGEAATALLGELGPDAKVLAGGQSLVPLLALRLARPTDLVDIGAASGLGGIDVDADGGVTIGAAVRHSEVEGSDQLASPAPLLAAAMPLIGHRAIRNRGTVCGSLAHADPAAELPAVVLAVDAELVLCRQGGERVVPAAGFFAGYLTTAIDDTELLAAVRFSPWPATTGWSIDEVSRRHGDFAMIGLAVVVGLGGDGRIVRAALSFFGAGSTPVRAAEAEAVLVGEPPGEALFAEAAAAVSKTLDPPSDNHASAAYRAHAAAVLTRRCLAEAAARAGVPAGDEAA